MAGIGNERIAIMSFVFVTVRACCRTNSKWLV